MDMDERDELQASLNLHENFPLIRSWLLWQPEPYSLAPSGWFVTQGKALGLRVDSDNSLQDITNIINIPKSAVHSINKRGAGIDKPRSGRPRKLSSRDIHQIERYICTNTFTRRVTSKRLKFNYLFRSDCIETASTVLGRVI
jgi:hypothetical protein